MSKFEKEKRRAKQHADKVKQKQTIYDIKHQYDKKHGMPTHKLITLYLFIILNVILVYALVAMWYFADLTHLGVLITDIMGQILTFVTYSHHSTAQNRVGGIQYMALQEKLRLKGEEDLTDEELNNVVG